MRNVTVGGWLWVCLVCCAALTAQEPQLPSPQAEHQWLQKFVGQWTTHSEGIMGPDQPPVECSGTISSRSLGGWWVLNELKSTTPAMPMHGLQTLGYDSREKKYVGTWVDSMTSHLWQYAGQVDATGKVLTLEAQGPNLMAEGKLSTYQDIYEFVSADEIKMSSRMQAEDGTWFTFMTGTAVRSKVQP